MIQTIMITMQSLQGTQSLGAAASPPPVASSQPPPVSYSQPPAADQSQPPPATPSSPPPTTASHSFAITAGGQCGGQSSAPLIKNSPSSQTVENKGITATYCLFLQQIPKSSGKHSIPATSNLTDAIGPCLNHSRPAHDAPDFRSNIRPCDFWQSF